MRALQDQAPPRCSWCDLRCRNQSDLAEHEADHRREDDLAAANTPLTDQQRKAA